MHMMNKADKMKRLSLSLKSNICSIDWYAKRLLTNILKMVARINIEPTKGSSNLIISDLVPLKPTAQAMSVAEVTKMLRSSMISEKICMLPKK